MIEENNSTGEFVQGTSPTAQRNLNNDQFNTPPVATTDSVTLSNTTLHYVKAGSGPPLVIVPATLSLIQQWEPLVQFIGQRYTSYFFELPGHGGSSPYPEQFSSYKVPQTVAEFMDAMGYERFNLMGFSFGGLLAMRTLEELQDRIDHVLLLSPCMSQRALLFSNPRQQLLNSIFGILKSPTVQETVVKLMHSERFDPIFITLLNKIGNLDKDILKSKNALRIPQSTLDVLSYTLQEILSLDYSYKDKPFQHKCFFGMSLYDDLLDYDTTLAIVKEHFDDLTIQHFTLPYHQPPQPPTYEWLNEEFGRFLEMLPA